MQIVLPPVSGVAPLMGPVGNADLRADTITTTWRKRAADDDLGTIEPGVHVQWESQIGGRLEETSSIFTGWLGG